MSSYIRDFTNFAITGGGAVGTEERFQRTSTAPSLICRTGSSEYRGLIDYPHTKSDGQGFVIYRPLEYRGALRSPENLRRRLVELLQARPLERIPTEA